MFGTFTEIERKVLNNKRLSKEDGIKLFSCNELSWIGALADHVRKEKCGILFIIMLIVMSILQIFVLHFVNFVLLVETKMPKVHMR